jgi:hypothetical protein
MTQTLPDQVISTFLAKIKSENILNTSGTEAVHAALSAEQFKKKDLEEAIQLGLKDENT